MGEHKFWGHIVDPGCTKTMDTGSSKRCWVCETDVRCGWWGERKMERESKRWGRPLPVGWTHCNPSTEEVTVTQQPVCGYSVRLAWGSPPLPPTPTPPRQGRELLPSCGIRQQEDLQQPECTSFSRSPSLSTFNSNCPPTQPLLFGLVLSLSARSPEWVGVSDVPCGLYVSQALSSSKLNEASLSAHHPLWFWLRGYLGISEAHDLRIGWEREGMLIVLTLLKN